MRRHDHRAFRAESAEDRSALRTGKGAEAESGPPHGPVAADDAVSHGCSHGVTNAIERAVTAKILPGPIIDLITDGPKIVANRGDIVKATRSAMLSMHRRDWSYAQMYALLTDMGKRRLAHLVGHGHGGRPIAAPKVAEFLRKHWDDTARVVATTPVPTAEDIDGFLEYAYEQLERARLSPRHRAIVEIAIDMAMEYGTTRIALPARVLADRLAKYGIPVSHVHAHKWLLAMCRQGEWLELAQRGSSTTRRANLYRVCPAARVTYSGLKHLSNPTHLSNPHLSNPSPEEPAVPATLTLTLSSEERAAVLRALADLRDASSAQPASEDATVIPLRRGPVKAPAYPPAPLRKVSGGSPETSRAPASPREGPVAHRT